MKPHIPSKLRMNKMTNNTRSFLLASSSPEAAYVGRRLPVWRASFRMLAANDVFYVSAVIFLLLIPLVFLTRHTKAGAGSADAAAGAH